MPKSPPNLDKIIKLNSTPSANQLIPGIGLICTAIDNHKGRPCYGERTSGELNIFETLGYLVYQLSSSIATIYAGYELLKYVNAS